MSSTPDTARQQLIRQVRGARSLAEIGDATQALHRWLAQHPDDLGIVDGFEALSMMQECAEARETSVTQEPAIAEQTP